MKLIEALKILQAKPPADAPPLQVALVCGFSPAHLQTFLTAHLRVLGPDWGVAVQTGLYGDCLGNLERLPADGLDAAAVALEWPDLDPRLGVRQLGGWGPAVLADILRTARANADRFEQAARRTACSLAVCLPTLPLPPVSHLPGRQAGPFELGLREAVGALAARLAGMAHVRVADAQWLDHRSSPVDRLDVRAELTSGFPYRVPHADAVAEVLAYLVRPPLPKKGLITDLDDTLWRGLVGEVGPGGVSWDLDHHSQAHGLYQQLLRALADAGVLVAVASKNDPDVVADALRREDLVLPADRLFPVEATWGPKSQSVARILRAWNVGADAVVFVDDSPMELAEVAAAHPGIECLAFPKQDDQQVYQLLERLRVLFGKPAVSAEDRIRLESLRRTADRPVAAAGEVAAEFLEQAEAEVALCFRKHPPDPRALELVNKTNQFNLNGRRFPEGGWLSHLKQPDRILMSVGYKDKYGPLGTIAVLAGTLTGGRLDVDCWVMSCRAFSRRIEHKCLQVLFDRFGVSELSFDFQPTPKNKPLQDFFAGFLPHPPDGRFSLSKGRFQEHCPPLRHQTKELTDD